MAFTERSRASREAVLAAARGAFAEHGYERSTVRGIAAVAGVDPSMVIRYFGSKESLFAAAVDVDLGLPDLSAVAPGQRGEVLSRHFLTLWESPPTAEILTSLLRASGTNADAAERFRRVFTDQVVELARSISPDGADATRRAGQLSTHMLGTALCRYILRLPTVAEPSAEEAIASLAQIVQRILDP